MNRTQTNEQALARLDKLGAKKKKGRYLFYKMTRRSRRPAIWDSRPVVYRDGTTVEPWNGIVDRRPDVGCGSGLNVLTGLPDPGEMAGYEAQVLLAVTVEPRDVVCVPDQSRFAGSHKLRVSKLKVIGRVNIREERKKLEEAEP